MTDLPIEARAVSSLLPANLALNGPLVSAIDALATAAAQLSEVMHDRGHGLNSRRPQTGAERTARWRRKKRARCSFAALSAKSALTFAGYQPRIIIEQTRR
jgi:hypothetical protein